MVTNRVEPNWCCDVCSASFGRYRSQAERCEATSVSEKPRVGALVLRCGYRGPYFVAVTEVEDDVRKGHKEHGYLFRLTGQRDAVLSAGWEWPGPGYARVEPSGFAASDSHRSSGWWHGYDGSELVGLSHAAGLTPEPTKGQRTHHQAGYVAGPLTPEQRDLLDALQLRPVTITGEWRSRGDWYAYTAAAIEADGVDARAAVLHAARPVSEEEMRRLWERWWEGEAVWVPLPKFRWTGANRRADGKIRRGAYQANLSASKLRKPQLAALEAAGIEWPERTDHDVFVRKMIGESKLPLEDEKRPNFGRPTIAVLSAKGGVGKSTVTAALAAAMAQRGQRVLIVDCDARNSSQAVLWEAGPLPVDEERVLLRPTPTTLSGVSVVSPGQFLAADDRAEWSHSTQEKWIEFVAANTDLDQIDVVLLDLPAGGGPAREVLFPWDGKGTATGAVLVVTGHRLVHVATTRWWATNGDEVSRTPVVLVENQSHLQTGTRVIGSTEATNALAAALGLAAPGWLPIADDHLELAAHPATVELAAALLANDPEVVVDEDEGEVETVTTTVTFGEMAAWAAAE